MADSAKKLSMELPTTTCPIKSMNKKHGRNVEKTFIWSSTIGYRYEKSKGRLSESANKHKKLRVLSGPIITGTEYKTTRWFASRYRNLKQVIAITLRSGKELHGEPPKATKEVDTNAVTQKVDEKFA